MHESGQVIILHTAHAMRAYIHRISLKYHREEKYVIYQNNNRTVLAKLKYALGQVWVDRQPDQFQAPPHVKRAKRENNQNR